MLNFRSLLVLALAAAALAIAVPAASASIAYIDGNEVWVSSDDGARKVRLSAGENDWREVAQSDQGYVVGTRREAGKISQLTSFTIWDPSGKVVHFGSLSGDFGGLNAYPLSFDITPSGGNLVYGFSHFVQGFPTSTLTTGTYLKVSADASTALPLKITSAKYPTLFGTRIVGTDDENVLTQDPSSIGSNNFAYWFNWTDAIRDVTRTDVSANGIISSTEMQTDGAVVDQVGVIKWGTFGASASYVDDCLLPISGNARNVSISQDATKMTWGDSRGVVVSPTPNLRPGGPANCEMPAAPVVISATGSYPSYGPFNVQAAVDLPTNSPTITAPKATKLATFLKKGLTITVTSPISGKATAKLTVKPKSVGKRGKKPITIATGRVNVTANVATKLKLKFSKTGKKLKKKLKRKKATLTVTVGGVTTSKTLKLK